MLVRGLDTQPMLLGFSVVGIPVADLEGFSQPTTPSADKDCKLEQLRMDLHWALYRLCANTVAGQ